MTTLKRFRVTNFKSVEDSGWIETDDVTALIGTNEAGKTNILLPLWKFNPAKEGAIVPTSDYPRKHFNAFRHVKPKPVFITAVFEVDDDLGRKLSQATGMPLDTVREVQVGRAFDGQYRVDFPDAAPIRAVERQRVVDILENTHREIGAMTPLKTEEELKKLLSSSLRTATESLPADELGAEHLESVLATLEGVKTDTAPKTSTIVPRHKQAVEEIRALHSELSREHPRDNDDAVDLVLENLPKFVSTPPTAISTPRYTSLM